MSKTREGKYGGLQGLPQLCFWSHSRIQARIFEMAASEVLSPEISVAISPCFSNFHGGLSPVCYI